MENKTFSISEVEELTGVKAHVLRYWEEVVPGFNPQKDLGGRRTYTQDDLEMIMRINYLINELRYTTEGACKQLIEDAETKVDNLEIISEIHQARAQLTDLYLFVKSLRPKTE